MATPLTVQKTAGILRVSTDTVLRDIAAGRLPAERTPRGAYRIAAGTLRRYIADNRVAASAA